MKPTTSTTFPKCDTEFTKDDIVMISGHLDAPQSYFDEYYIPLIYSALMMGCKFVIGDARGIDAFAQAFLHSLGIRDVVIFHATTPSYNTPRHNIGKWPTDGNWATQTQKDAAMTAKSTKDIAFVAEGREHRGTALNLLRRQEQRSLRKEPVVEPPELQVKQVYIDSARQMLGNPLPGLVFKGHGKTIKAKKHG